MERIKERLGNGDIRNILRPDSTTFVRKPFLIRDNDALVVTDWIERNVDHSDLLLVEYINWIGEACFPAIFGTLKNDDDRILFDLRWS